MNTMHVTKNRLLLLSAFWWVIFVLLSLTGFNQFQVLNIIGFPVLMLVPGILSVALFRLEKLSFWPQLATVVAFSLLELMVVGLIANTFLPLAGIPHPLDKYSMLWSLSMWFIALWSACALFISKGKVLYEKAAFFQNGKSALLALSSALFVPLSMLGAFSLNNGGSNIFTMALLAGVALYLCTLIYHAERVGKNVLPTAIFFISLSFLFMTSLRGWYITGHDIQWEYKVFELAKNAGVWSMAAYRDAYNACLSITILPTVLFNLLKVADQYVYKVFFQIIFALCPVLMYLISRNWMGRRMSLYAALYFIGFPTFFEDMPFLARQEIAFLFFGLMIYLIFNEKLNIHIRRIAFLFMGIGVVLSHYSTTYTVVLIFGLFVFFMPMLRAVFNFLQIKKGVFRASALERGYTGNHKGRARVTVLMLTVLIAASVVWTTLVTDTSGNLTKVANETLAAIKNGFTENSRSIDAISLISFGKPSQKQELQDYVKNIIDPERANAPLWVFYDESTYSKYNIGTVENEHLPLSPLGSFLSNLGIPVKALLSIFGQVLAKSLEILAPLGIIYVLFRRRIVKTKDQEYFVLAIFGFFFILLNILLPVLSTEYGVFRALQQCMFLLAPFMVIGSFLVGIFLEKLWMLSFGKLKHAPAPSKYSIRDIFPAGLVVLFILYSTTFIPQLFGGNDPALHLNNSGIYYDNYYIHDAELASISWLTDVSKTYAGDGVNRGREFNLQVDRYAQNRVRTASNLEFGGDIYPSIVAKNSYVFLSESNVTKDRASVLYNGDVVTYSYPLQFLDDNKNLLYSNGKVRVYK